MNGDFGLSYGSLVQRDGPRLMKTVGGMINVPTEAERRNPRVREQRRPRLNGANDVQLMSSQQYLLGG